MLSFLSKGFSFIAIMIIGMISGLKQLKKVDSYRYASLISAFFAIAASILEGIFVGAFSVDVLNKPLDVIILFLHLHIAYCFIHITISDYKESLVREREAKMISDKYEELLQQASKITGTPMEKSKLEFTFKRNRRIVTSLFILVIVVNLFSALSRFVNLC